MSERANLSIYTHVSFFRCRHNRDFKTDEVRMYKIGMLAAVQKKRDLGRTTSNGESIGTSGPH